MINFDCGCVQHTEKGFYECKDNYIFFIPKEINYFIYVCPLHSELKGKKFFANNSPVHAGVIDIWWDR